MHCATAIFEPLVRLFNVNNLKLALFKEIFPGAACG